MAVTSTTSTSSVNTAVTNTAPTTASSSAAATKPGSSIITALGGGSGVNVGELAKNLVAAERAPQQAMIDKAIQASQAKISGYGTVLSSLSAFKGSLTALQDKSQFNTLSVQSNASGFFDVTADSNAQPANHKINVLSLATVQTNVSGGFSSATATLNGGAAITLDLTVGGTAVTPAISVSASGGSGPTPNDLVVAINGAGAGVTASIVDTGYETDDRYKIVLTSTSTGSASSFSLSTSATGVDGVTALSFSTVLQAASNARLVVDGVDMVRSSNSISDAIAGVTLNLLSPTSTDGTLANSTPGSISLARDTRAVKAKVQALVDAFNSTKALLKTVSDVQSKNPDGATLPNDSLVRKIGSQITAMVTSYSSTPGGNDINALRDIGVSIQRDGTLSLDATKLDATLNSKFSDVVKMLSGNQDNSKGTTLSGARGLAGDAVKQLTELLGTSGPILTASNNATSNISFQNKKVADLEIRMTELLARYTNQFSVMDSIVGQMNSLKTSLANQFTAWANQKG